MWRDLGRLAELDGERLLTLNPRGTPFTDLLLTRLAPAGAHVEPVPRAHHRRRHLAGAARALVGRRRVAAAASRAREHVHRPAGERRPRSACRTLALGPLAGVDDEGLQQRLEVAVAARVTLHCAPRGAIDRAELKGLRRWVVAAAWLKLGAA